MRIDLEIRAHLGRQVAANLLFSIFKGGEFVAEIEPAVAAFSFPGLKPASDLSAARELPYSPLELRALHPFSLGQFCPSVKQS